MTLNEDDEAHGYTMSPRVAELIESEQDEEVTVRAFIADIFAQRIKSHHAEAMDGQRFAEHLDRFIERAPRIIEVIVIKDGVEDFSIQQVQRITDDLVCLDDREFVRHYGLEDLFAALTRAEASGKLIQETPYQALARHLQPDDPPAGALEIDKLILAQKRAEVARWNRQRGASIAGPCFFAIGVASLAVPLLFRSVDPSTPFPLPTLPPFASIFVIVAAIGLMWMSFRWLDDVADPPLPEAVAQWLSANNETYGIRYWDDHYWPTAKRLACERTFFGFTIWKKVPPPEAEWPELRFDDPEWDYWERGGGRTISKRYYPQFADRIERWNARASQVLLACFLLFMGGSLADTTWAIFSDDHSAVLATPTSKVAVIFIAILLSIALGRGYLPRLRWLPRSVRRWWFGPLPANAEAYRDFLLRRTF